MISIQFDDKTFFKEMLNVANYSEGFLEGIEDGKSEFAKSIGRDAIEIFKDFVDQNARVDERMYHHIYEWYQTGSPEARLFDVEYVEYDGGLTFNGRLSQSKTLQSGSTTPFYNKAEIMENGIPVTIKPTRAKVLSFNIEGEQVFTPNAVDIQNPGGTHQLHAFEHIFDLFFKQHFTQSVLELTGIKQYLENPKVYKNNLQSAKTGGKSKGQQVGYNWIVNAGGLSV
jgi:hypothetical protein